MVIALLILGTLLLAWSNGANDNFKGVATLYGGGVLSFRAALACATLATMAGGLVSVLFAERLAKTFSGAAILHGGALDATTLAAMLVGAGLTVLLATFLKMPTSTTHALMGSLVGVALAIDPARIRVDRLGSLFFAPMLLSPLIAIVTAAGLYFVSRGVVSRWAAPASDACLCAGTLEPELAASAGGAAALSSMNAIPIRVRMGTPTTCGTGQGAWPIQLKASHVANVAHGLSGGAVCFARALNDTPKIAAVLLATGALAGANHAAILAAVTSIVVLGGIFQSRGVAHTMSKRITTLNSTSGLAANVVTASLVLWASRLGVPVSTTHVSCGSILGIGAATRRAESKTIRRIVGAWVVTFPFAAGLGASLLLVLRSLVGVSS